MVRNESGVGKALRGNEINQSLTDCRIVTEVLVHSLVNEPIPFLYAINKEYI